MKELGIRILRPNETAARVGICDRELRDLESQGLFPKRFKLNPSGKGRAVGHLQREVDAWIESRADTARAQSGSKAQKEPVASDAPAKASSIDQFLAALATLELKDLQTLELALLKRGFANDAFLTSSYIRAKFFPVASASEEAKS